MEKLFGSRAMRYVAGVGLVLAVALSGCAEPEITTPSTVVTLEDMTDTAGVTYVRPGETAFVSVYEGDSQALIGAMTLVDHMYPNGPEDDMAPSISTTPQRLRAIVAVTGRSPELAQDAACDTLQVADPQGTASIGALALGGSEGAVFITWPRGDEGQPGDYAYMCSFQEMEPKDDGVVVFAQTAQQ